MSNPTSPSITPRDLNIRQAAAYWGVSHNTYKKLYLAELAPAPLNLPGLDRKVFDRIELDRAMDALRQSGAAG